MNTQTQNSDTSFSIELLKSLAFMQYNGEDYFIYNGKAYEGNEKELHSQWVECTENLPDAQTWEEFIEDNAPEVEEFYNDDYLVLTDEEADEKAAEYIRDSVWAFNSSFIIEHSRVLDFDEASEKIVSAIGEQCESGNDAMTKLIDDMEEFIEDAISADGRGHFMSSYDGEENEVTVPDSEYNEKTTFYIYRLN